MPVKKEKVAVTVYTCSRCGHRWLPRKPFDPIDLTALPKKCSACASPLWDSERVRKIDDLSKARDRSSK